MQLFLDFRPHSETFYISVITFSQITSASMNKLVVGQTLHFGDIYLRETLLQVFRRHNYILSLKKPNIMTKLQDLNIVVKRILCKIRKANGKLCRPF